MRLPGFTADASLYNSTDWQPSARKRGQPTSMRAVMPQVVAPASNGAGTVFLFEGMEGFDLSGYLDSMGWGWGWGRR